MNEEFFQMSCKYKNKRETSNNKTYDTNTTPVSLIFRHHKYHRNERSNEAFLSYYHVSILINLWYNPRSKQNSRQCLLVFITKIYLDYSMNYLDNIE